MNIEKTLDLIIAAIVAAGFVCFCFDSIVMAMVGTLLVLVPFLSILIFDKVIGTDEAN